MDNEENYRKENENKSASGNAGENGVRYQKVNLYDNTNAFDNGGYNSRRGLTIVRIKATTAMDAVTGITRATSLIIAIMTMLRMAATGVPAHIARHIPALREKADTIPTTIREAARHMAMLRAIITAAMLLMALPNSRTTAIPISPAADIPEAITAISAFMTIRSGRACLTAE